MTNKGMKEGGKEGREVRLVFFLKLCKMKLVNLM
jgi:hypothetical protein